MKKISLFFLAILFIASLCVGCAQNPADKQVLIYSSTEEYRNEYFLSRLKEQFPDYSITIEYMPSGNLAAKLVAEGVATQGDILLDIEYGYIDKLESVLADLSAYDKSVFVEDLLYPTNKVFPMTRNGGCIAINPAILESKGLAVPQSYADLLKPEYKGLISMPNPKSSGTGYMFLKSLVNAWGEDAAFEYFDELSKNILQFTSSGSGPVNALVQGEAAIGLAMTAQSVTQINEGVELEVLFFEEGSPYSLYGVGMVAGKEKSKAVKDVFEFFLSTLIAEDKEKFFPEKVFKDLDFIIENYPSDIDYSDMSNNSNEEKERLLEKWNH